MHSNENINSHLLEERKKCTFSQEAMTNFLDGSEEDTERRRHIEKLVTTDPDMNFTNPWLLSREEQYEEGMRKSCLMIRKLQEHGINDHTMAYHYGKMIMNHESGPFAVHFVMFIPAFLSQADEEQQAYWLPKALNYEIIGTYAQTELGHGTFIRGLETTATYDEKTEEFVIHTPNIEATKWWPGNLGKSANHTLVVAQLYSRGRCYGLHYFVVQLRDLDTHAILPGITVGDIGPKMGFPSNDNGYLQLNNVRVPRCHMLARHGEVLPSGEYVSKRNASEKLGYGTMLLVRSVLIKEMGVGLAEAATIATRYSAIRLQGYAINVDAQTRNQPETKLLDYVTQQLKLTIEISHAYTYWIVGLQMRQLFFNVQSEIDGGDTEKLPRLHALSAGLKAISTWDSSTGVENCRMACGGHGYSLASGLPQIYTDVVAGCTYEGDNVVLLLQTAKYLLKTFTFNQELSTCIGILGEEAGSPSWQNLQKAHNKRAYKLLESLHSRFILNNQNTESMEHFYQQEAIHLVECAKAHCRALVCEMFSSAVKNSCDSIRDVLWQMVSFYAVHWIITEEGSFIRTGCFGKVNSSGGVNNVLESYRFKLLQLLRPNLVGLVDSFDLHDRVLNSALGRYDGQVYSHLLEWAKKAPFNKQDIMPSFYSSLRPLMRGEKIAPMKAKL